MRKYLQNLFCTIVLLLAAYPVSARTRFQGYAERGGQTAITALTGSSVSVQRSFPLAQYEVFSAGTTTPATIYSNAAGTPKVCPCTTDSTGYIFFYGDAAGYDVRISPAGVTAWIVSAFGSGNPGTVTSVIAPVPSGGDDYAALQAIITANQGTARIEIPCGIYLISSELTVLSQNASISGCGLSFNLPNLGTTLRATGVGMRSVLAWGAAGGDASMGRLDNIRLDANRIAKYGIYLGGASFNVMSNIYAEHALFDGWYISADQCDGTCPFGFNDTFAVTMPWAVSNGTFYHTTGLANLSGNGAANDCSHQVIVTGTATLTASSSTVTITGSSTNLTTLGVRKGDLIVVGAGAVTSTSIYIGQIDHVINSTSLALEAAAANLPTAAQAGAGQPFGIAIGDGWHEARSGNNNTYTVTSGLFRDNCAAGISTRALFGPTFIGPMIDNGGLIACTIGDADTVSLMVGGLISHPYAESDIPWTFGLFGGQNIHIDAPVANIGSQFAVANNTTGTVRRGDFTESIQSGLPQTFYLTVDNAAGTLRASFRSEISFGFLNFEQVSRITSPSATLVALPAVSNVVGFAAGAGIWTGGTQFLLLDTPAAQPLSPVSTTNIVVNTTGTAYTAAATTLSANINGVTRQRLAVTLINATGTNALWDTTTIPAGKQIVLSFAGRIR